MMVILNLIFWLIILAVLFVVGFVLFGVFWGIGILILRPRKRWRWFFAGAPAYLLLFVSLLLGVYWHATRPANVFRSEFSFSPPATVNDLQSSTWSLADSGHAYLFFEADQATIRRIVSQGMAPSDALPSTTVGDAPDWWQPADGPGVEIYTSNMNLHGFASEYQLLVYDPATQEAFWYSEGID